MKKPFKTYNGGKEASGVYQKIINEIRPHNMLIIPFLGNCAVSRRMQIGLTIRVGYDLDPLVINAWDKVDHNFAHIHQSCGIKAIRSNEFDYNSNYKIVIYIDPPYVIESRKQQKELYNCELSLEQHQELIKNILWVNSNYPNVDVLVSHYEHELYLEAFKCWRLKKFTAKTRGGVATEYLWMNYDNAIGLLHDYSYVGETSVRRDNLKVKKKSLIERMSSMDTKEKNYLFKSLIDYFPEIREML